MRVLIVGMIALLALNACGKKSSPKTPPPSAAEKTAQPTSGAGTTPYEGNWLTLCDNFIRRRIVIKKDLLTYTQERYSDASCLEGPPQPVEGQDWSANFKLAAPTLSNYDNLIQYLDKGSVWYEENILKDSNGISLESEPFVFVKQP